MDERVWMDGVRELKRSGLRYTQFCGRNIFLCIFLAIQC